MQGTYAEEFEILEISADAVIQGEHYSGDHLELFSGYTRPVSQIIVRHASIGIEGKVNEYVDFEFRAGSATCLSGGLFSLMDAAVFYKPIDYVRAGFIKGEILRGFEFAEECTNVLTAEKPRFAQVFAPCHPTGFAAEYSGPLAGSMHLTGQFALLNGASSQNLDEEYDTNIGFQLQTPVEGLSAGGFYSLLKKNYGYDQQFELINGAGYRTGFGLDYDTHDLLFRGEYYLLKGYYNDPMNNTLYEDAAQTQYIPSTELKMQAYYVEGGYAIHTGVEAMPAVLPYVRYQSWDKAANADGDHVYTYLTCGISMALGNDQSTILRFDFDMPVDTPEGLEKDSEMLIVRLQTDLSLKQFHH
ncbi:hypothetical protein KKH18_04245 [bacterium]|nr:hypothetical protein [bacterium]